jgi:hypothetical protein
MSLLPPGRLFVRNAFYKGCKEWPLQRMKNQTRLSNSIVLGHILPTLDDGKNDASIRNEHWLNPEVRGAGGDLFVTSKKGNYPQPRK